MRLANPSQPRSAAQRLRPLAIAALSVPILLFSSGSSAQDESAAGGAASPKVAMAQFTTAVENREPVDSISFLSTALDKIVFFTDLRDLAGETITHRWEYKGKTMAEVRFEVGAARWRIWSSKRLMPAWVGEWTASIVREDGEVLAQVGFDYIAEDS